MGKISNALQYTAIYAFEHSLYHPLVVKEKQRFWKRILIVDDDEDAIITFKAVIEDSSNHNKANRRIQVYT
jgi:hypothetical protein